MLLTKEVEVNLKGSKPKYYELLGYIIPKKIGAKGKEVYDYSKSITVKVEDLSKGSHAEVLYTCDVCEKSIPCMYKTYLYMKKDSYTDMDTCNDCKFVKIKKTNLLKYGVDNILSIPEVRQICYDENRHSYEFIKEEFKKLDYILLTQEYINNTQKLEYICSRHRDYGVQTTMYSDMKRHGSSCRMCANEKIRKIQLNDFDNVVKEFDDLGYIPYFKESDYIDCHTPLKCSCKKHPNEKFKVSLVHAREQKGCEECFREKTRGENHWNWKGGISNLSCYLRDKIKQWRFDSLKNNKFKCIITGLNDGSLVVHHLYSYTQLIKETLDLINIPLYPEVSMYNDKELNMIENKFVELHYQKGLGKPILSSLHKIFHSIAGDLIIDDGEFEDFINKYNNFEFDNLLEDKYKYCNLLKIVS